MMNEIRLTSFDKEELGADEPLQPAYDMMNNYLSSTSTMSRKDILNDSNMNSFKSLLSSHGLTPSLLETISRSLNVMKLYVPPPSSLHDSSSLPMGQLWTKSIVGGTTHGQRDVMSIVLLDFLRLALVDCPIEHAIVSAPDLVCGYQAWLALVRLKLGDPGEPIVTVTIPKQAPGQSISHHMANLSNWRRIEAIQNRIYSNYEWVQFALQTVHADFRTIIKKKLDSDYDDKKHDKQDVVPLSWTQNQLLATMIGALNGDSVAPRRHFGNRTGSTSNGTAPSTSSRSTFSSRFGQPRSSGNK